MMTIAKRLDKHFAVCAAVGAAIVGGVQQSEAAVIFSGPVSINIPSTTAGVYLNVVTGISSTSPASAPGWDVNPWSSTSLNMFTPTPNPGGGSYNGTGATYFNLTVGDTIGVGSTWSGTGTATLNGGTPLNFNSSNNYVGFRFINEANGNAIHYGWMQIAVAGTAAGQPRTIVGYAYEDVAGASITIPGPGALALLGLAGLVGHSRRRRV
jgi:hypothetical protein